MNLAAFSHKATYRLISSGYAKLKPRFVIGIVRMRSPVAVNTAFAIAGKIGGSAGSPKPVGKRLDLQIKDNRPLMELLRRTATLLDATQQ